MDEKNEEIKKAQSDSQDSRNGVLGGLILTVSFIIIIYITYSMFFEFLVGKIILCISVAATLIFFMVAISCYFDFKEAKRIEKLQEDATKEESDLQEIDPSKRALRAEKLFKINQKELMRYYDMNIVQTKFLSVLGIGMIVFGLAIASISGFAYISLGSDKLLLIVGNISGGIADFIGAVFIKMYTQSLKAAVKFHEKFTNSNNLLLANAIANKIENEDLRENTLADISKSIISIRNDRPNE